MFNFKLFGNIKLTVLIGYIILFGLAIFGLTKIYKELVNFSEFSNPLNERKELNIVSNAVVSLYEAESMRKMMLTENFYTPSLYSYYNQLDQKVRVYVDSLYDITSDNYLQSSLDTVNTLLDEKKNNFIAMMALMDSIKKLPYSKILSTKILSNKDVSNLGNIINDKIVQHNDTSYYIRERRSFIDRVRAVFSNKEDSTKVVSAEGKLLKDTSMYSPAKIITDTLVQYINDVNDKSDKRKIAYMTKLSNRQNAMLYYDEMLTGQINSILRRIEDEERRMILDMRNEKSKVLARSSKIVSRIATATIIVLILFLPLTMLLINRNQRFRNDLERSNAYAKKLLKSREQLLLMISHDVKAPLSSIIGHIELMYKEKLPAKEKEHLSSMRTSSEQILDLSNKLMDFHRLEQGKSEINVVAFSPYTLMNDIYKSFVPLADKKNLMLKLKSDIDPDGVYEGDPFIIRQILNNLISNALKFTGAGSVVVTARVDKATDKLQIDVRDTGVGIHPDEINKIFEEFGRVGSYEEKQSIDGFGLGLPITKQLVNLLNGEMNLTSELNKGTEFKVSIPLVKTDTALTEKEQEAPKVLSNKVSANVLLVDDDEAILNVYSKLLEREGLNVMQCHSPLEVVKMINEQKVDIIFTDIQMPQMNGFELVKSIRELGGIYANIPIVALSARSDVSEKDFVAAGFTAFIAKPVPFDRMYKVVGQLIDDNKVDENPEQGRLSGSVSGFDALIEFVKDDKELSLDILQTFLSDSKQKIETIQEAILKKDWAVIKSTAHKMLPLMRMIDEKGIVKILVGLEAGLQDDDKVQKLILLTNDVNRNAQRFIDDFIKKT